jgi:acyl carrier protein
MPNKKNVNIVLSLLINFIKNEIATSNIEITKNTNLKDLSLDGLKGIMFIKKYSAEFKVNIDTFDFEKYFTEKNHKLNNTAKTLTIACLEKAIINGKFDAEP